tara:strand:- start:5993 stop:6973 length:981 start_codon:yes stop_codon:yes gene_type:complete
MDLMGAHPRKEVVSIKSLISYRKRRDLMLKKFSSPSIVKHIAESCTRNSLVTIYKLGRPCEVRKELLVSYVVFSRMSKKGYETMEQESELYLNRHYDHSAFQYHYTKLDKEVIIKLTYLFRDKIYELTNEIYLHILDSTALSTSVRVPRTRQGLRKKEKLTDKFHSMLGYDPPLKFVVVDSMLSTDHHTSDGKGGEIMLDQVNIKGYSFGDSKYGTYGLIQKTEDKNLIPIYKQDKREPRKKLSAKRRHRDLWDKSPKRLYKEIRGVGEVLYGAATRAGLIHTQSRRPDNRAKDGLLIGLRQNTLTYLRLKALIRIIRKTHLYSKV